MVNSSWTARPPIPAVHSRALVASPPTLPTQTPSAPPAGFLVFGQFPPRYSARIPKFSGREIGARQPDCRALRHRMPRLMADHPHTIDRWDDATGENLPKAVVSSETCGLVEASAHVGGLVSRGYRK